MYTRCNICYSMEHLSLDHSSVNYPPLQLKYRKLLGWMDDGGEAYGHLEHLVDFRVVAVALIDSSCDFNSSIKLFTHY
jgi:hypothetical protein